MSPQLVHEDGSDQFVDLRRGTSRQEESRLCEVSVKGLKGRNYDSSNILGLFVIPISKKLHPSAPEYLE